MGPRRNSGPEAMRSDFAATARRDTYPMLIAAAEGRLTLRLLPEERRDGEAGLPLSPEGWDSEMVTYPMVFRDRGTLSMLYNGNGYGRRSPTVEQAVSRALDEHGPNGSSEHVEPSGEEGTADGSEGEDE